MQLVDGAGGAERLTTPEDGREHIPEAWSPDGRHLLFSVYAPDSAFTLWSVSIEDGEIEQIEDIDSLEPISASFSPDGNWIGYHSMPESGAELATISGVFIEPFPQTGARYQLEKLDRDFQPVWSRDEMALNFVPSTASGQLASFGVEAGAGLDFAVPTIFPFGLVAARLSTATRGFDVLPGGRFVGLTSDAESNSAGAPTEIRYVLNWFEELKELVPVE